VGGDVTFVPEMAERLLFTERAARVAPISIWSKTMQKMKFFIDTHDQTRGSFPAEISKEDFAGFYEVYETACAEEGVVSLRIHVGFDEGRAFCLNMAPSAEAVRRVHEKVGLMFDTITEVTTVTPGDMYFVGKAA
jgi:hypothetical protein